MFFVYVPISSMNPVIVTFGAGACAMAGGARTPRTATRATASINSLLITASSKRGELQQRIAVPPKADSHNRSRLRTTWALYGTTGGNVKSKLHLVIWA